MQIGATKYNLMRQVEQIVYSFSELSDAVKAKVLENFRDFNLYGDWWTDIFEDFKEDNKFEVGEIHFSGFSNQGDGAMFEYSGYDFKSWVDGLALPEWKRSILKACDVSVGGVHRGNYCHYNTCSHDCDIDLPGMYTHDNVCKFIGDFAGKFEQHIKEEYKSLCNDLYRALEKEYDSLTSDESVQESIEANEYEFYHNGTLYHN